MRFWFVLWVGLCAGLAILLSGPIAADTKVNPADMLHWLGIVFMVAGFFVVPSFISGTAPAISSKLAGAFGVVMVFVPLYSGTLATLATGLLQLALMTFAAVMIGNEMSKLPGNGRPFFYTGSTWCALVGAAAFTFLVYGSQGPQGDIVTYAKWAAAGLYALGLFLARKA